MEKPGPLACNWRGALALQPTPNSPALAGSQDIPGPWPVRATVPGIQSPALLGGGRGTVVGWVVFLCSSCTYPDLDPCDMLLSTVASRGAQNPLT